MSKNIIIHLIFSDHNYIRNQKQNNRKQKHTLHLWNFIYIYIYSSKEKYWKFENAYNLNILKYFL